MPSVSNIAVGALVAGSAAASKARHGMNESIARLSTGMRSMYGGDAAGQSVANTLQARSMKILGSCKKCRRWYFCEPNRRSSTYGNCSLSSKIKGIRYSS